MTKTCSPLSSRLETKANSRPSGDHLGALSVPLVKSVGLCPSSGTSQIFDEFVSAVSSGCETTQAAMSRVALMLATET